MPQNQPESSAENTPERTSSAIALILVITVASVFGISLILLTLGVALDKITFADAKDVFSLMAIALVSLAGTSLGFYFGSQQK